MPVPIKMATRYGGLSFPKILPPVPFALECLEGGPRFGVITLNHSRVRLLPTSGHDFTHLDNGAQLECIAPTAGPANVAINFSDVAGVSSAVATGLIKGHPLDSIIRRGYRAMGVNVFGQAEEAKYSPSGPQYGLVFSPAAWGPDTPKVQYMLANEIAAQLKAGDFNWEKIFSHGSVYAHTDGIFLAVGTNTPSLINDFFTAAGQRQILRSFDLNFRPGPLKDIYGEDYKTKAQAIYQQIMANVDILEGNRDDLQDALGIPMPDTTGKSKLDFGIYREMITEAVRRFKNLKVVLANLAQEEDANHHFWTALLYINDQFFEAPLRNIFVRDRIGRGDATTFGTLYGLMMGWPEQEIVDFAWAAGAKAMAALADTIKVSLEDIKAYAQAARKGGNVARVQG